ncbi:N-acetylmuramoyl-L-alanine amidase [Nocardioides cavernaquae]|uniref:N-acetylmuramoyl-L-alanine amidase n=1 Tax=Nocardioides cavernaquae TaxID=2321396 RepID=A0A3A5H357_9ACTN|nr:N-acetylmuramoyl-L-alanine amidase [Nocardioides cavernaquae]RJS45102.1 hypothetical protein D4739_01805 [Nocardioides cavernaquae]
MRKQLLGAIVATALFVLIGALCAVFLVDPGRPGERGVLSGDGPGKPGMRQVPSVRSVSVPLAGRLTRGADGGSSTRTMQVERFSQVAVVWRGPRVPRTDVRIRHAGRWSAWQPLEPLEDLEAGEGNGTKGSDLLWAGPSDAIRVRTRGPVPRDLELVLIDPDGPAEQVRGEGIALAAYVADPTTTPSPVAASTSASTTTAPAAAAYPLTSPPPFNPPSHYAPRPTIYGRKIWGANETWRNDIPYYSDTLVQAHLHHTASANSYTRAAVPGIIRGMYSYHTRTLGWADIGYNFLVDRFGRIWQGRAGGIKHPVRGAHTLGFNNRSVGVAVIGNHETARPTTYAVTSVIRLITWKLEIHRRRPASYTYATSEGSDRFAAGRVVRLPVIDGHRDTNQTACPGGYLYARLPEIRRRAQLRADAF